MADARAPRGRRPSGPAPNYALRRLVALAVLLVVVVVAWRGVAALIGGGDEELAAVESPGDGGTSDGTGAGAAPPAAGTAAAAAQAPGSTAPPTPAPVETEPEPEDTGPPTPSNRAEVYIVGDSDAGTFGPYLQSLLDGTKLVDSELDYKVSSGLARPDFYDWPARLRETLPEVDPDIVVATFGGNDAQPLTLAQESFEVEVGDPMSNQEAWSAEYERRVGEAMDLMLEDGRRLVWVGIPNAADPGLTERFTLQDRAAKAAAEARPDVVFIDTWNRFTGRDGGYADFVIDPRDGVGKDVRASDGFHLNQNGAEILAIDIALAVQEELREMGADI